MADPDVEPLFLTAAPDVTGPGIVECPCGAYSCSTALFDEVGWPFGQAVCPNCWRVLEPMPDA